MTLFSLLMVLIKIDHKFNYQHICFDILKTAIYTSEEKRDLQKSTHTAKTLAYLIKNISQFIFNSD